MTKVIRWETPDTRQESRRHAWQAAADELRAHPGEWAVIYEGSHVQAQTTAAMVRNAYAPWDPKGSFEVKTRTVPAYAPPEYPGTKTVITYARYVGGEST